MKQTGDAVHDLATFSFIGLICVWAFGIDGLKVTIPLLILLYVLERRKASDGKIGNLPSMMDEWQKLRRIDSETDTTTKRRRRP